LNAITDVAGVEVGQVTLIDGDGRLIVGQGPVRTGVTVVHPRGKESTEGVFAGWFTLNASGEMRTPTVSVWFETLPWNGWFGKAGPPTGTPRSWPRPMTAA
jgi:L-aminopeptidase/D-esterase-like protein